MPAKPLEQQLAIVIRLFDQLIHTNSWGQWKGGGLTPTQRKILKFLSSSEAGQSLSRVARELGVTVATACDSVDALASKKLLSKANSTTDGRRLALTLTEGGQQVAKNLWSLPDPLYDGFDALASEEQQTAYILSLKVIHALQRADVLPPSNACVRCQFFNPFRDPNTSMPHYCNRAGTSLAPWELRLDCSVFAEADFDLQATLWNRFTEGTSSSNPTPTVNAVERHEFHGDPLSERQGVSGTEAPHGVDEKPAASSGAPRERELAVELED